jgi:ankyrin repeat protein
MLKQYGTRIDNLGDDCLLHTAAMEGNAYIIEFLLESVRAAGHKDTESRLLTGRDNRKRTAWYIAADKGELKVLQIIWDFAKDNPITGKMKNELLLATDFAGYTTWHSAALQGATDVFQKIWDLAKENVTSEEMKNKLL